MYRRMITRHSRSFRKGERFAVLNDKDQFWLWVNRLGSADTGFVPRTLVQQTV